MPDVVITTGSTFENEGNLPPHLLAKFREQYDGTNRGRQELYAEVLEDVAGALWTRDQIDKLRLQPGKDRVPSFRRIVVAVDPMVTNIAVTEGVKGFDERTIQRVGGSETGIIGAALGSNGHAYVLKDWSLSASPMEWAQKAVGLYEELRADRLVAEKNNGGALVEVTVRTVMPNIAYKAVHATQGKYTRAEPVAALYEQGKVHHVGLFPELEDQLTTYTGDPNEKSPDRLDALVWALTELMLGERYVPMVGPEGVVGTNYWSGKPDETVPYDKPKEDVVK